MKKIIFIFLLTLLLSGCSLNNKRAPEINTEIKNEYQAPSSVNLEYEDDDAKIYSFSQGLNNVDLNFDGLDDAVFVSHIIGADYYDYHVFFDRDIYSFYINNQRTEPNSDYWSLVTREIIGKKIGDFDKDFVVPEILGCNGGGLLRLAKINNVTYLLLISPVENNNKSDMNVKVEIYKLTLSGNLRGSDYIFSYVDTFISKDADCGIESIYEAEIPNIVKFVKSKSEGDNKNLTYNQLMSYGLENSDTPGYFNTEKKGKEIEWQAKISNYYSQITGIKFCVVDDEHQNVDINQPCDMFWAFADELMDADNIATNPIWDGNWVKYILNYYNVPFDENSDYFNDIYTVKGVINGIDCAPSDKCSPDIEIISINK